MLYAIGDLHLSLASDKPMDVFGGNWENYTEKIKQGFSALGDEDITVICGDISWGMSLEESLEDFSFIHALPGEKIILKGNHDYWWTTASKMQRFFDENGLDSLRILHNNCFFYKDAAICGTRGWFYEEERGGEQDKKILNREIMRLEASLKAAGEVSARLCFLHYPPMYNDYRCGEMIELMERYGVRDCYYGHIHGAGRRYAVCGEYGGISYNMVSADHVDFKPVKILD